MKYLILLLLLGSCSTHSISLEEEIAEDVIENITEDIQKHTAKK